MLYLHSKTAFSSNNLIQRIIDCPVRKGCVVVEHMVSAVVVMVAPAIIRTVGGIPDIRKLCHCLRLFLIELL